MNKPVVLALCAACVVIGFYVGATRATDNAQMAADKERSKIGQECRSSGSFVVRRTAFDCGVRRK
jgi:hypothetical protein